MAHRTSYRSSSTRSLPATLLKAGITPLSTVQNELQKKKYSTDLPSRHHPLVIVSPGTMCLVGKTCVFFFEFTKASNVITLPNFVPGFQIKATY